MNKYVKFTGKLLDLIPNGWKFGKAFARNYRYYSKTCQHYSDEDFRVWQHLGGYVEYEDWYNLSWVIFDLVQSGRYTEGKAFSKYYRFTVNHETGETQEYIEPMFMYQDEPNAQELYRDFYHKHKQLVFTDNEVKFIQEMITRGWVEICEDTRKKS